MALFPTGVVIITPNALESLDPNAVKEGLRRHLAGDWGELDHHDWRENEMSLAEGRRLFSAYRDGGKKFWIITEADRSATTILLPDDY